MKRLFVFVPAIILVLFLANSFVPKEKEAGKKTTKSGRVNMVLKSTNGGQTWQDVSKEVQGASSIPQLQNQGRTTNKLESEGVLIATGTEGIKRSTDNGEHWQWVISEGGVGIAVERIEGGFAAIAYNTSTKSRRIHISLDNGKTWKIISDGLVPSPSISSIKQMGKYLICGHPDGIFRSSDMGKTWSSVHPSVDKNESKFATTWNKPFSDPGRVFKIYVSDDVLYAVAVSAGC
jgi:photosystem II stability/assembly factor-like uncharacterized protein